MDVNYYGILEINDRVSYGVCKNGSFKKFKSVYPTNDTFYVNTKKQFQTINIIAIIRLTGNVSNNGTKIGTIHEYIGDINDNNNLKKMYEKIALDNWSTDKQLKKLVTDNCENHEIYNDGVYERLDMTDCEVYSIDPDNCEDIDDALSIRHIGNRTEIGIHISDVSSHVSRMSVIEMEIKKRIESVYLMNDTLTVHNMLPLGFMEKCTLKENCDKNAVSVLLYYDNDMIMIESKIVRTVVNVRKNLTYDEANKFIENMDGVVYELFDFSKKIQNKEQKYNNSHNKYDSHDMVELYMILANKKVAEVMHNDIKFGVYRTQKNKQKSKCKSILRKCDYDADTNEKILKARNNINMLSATYMLYESDINDISSNLVNLKHEALDIDLYTHFTSPMRRYFDIIVHRILFNEINKNDIKDLGVVIDCINNEHCKYKKIYDRYDKISKIEAMLKCDEYIDNGFITSDGYVIDMNNNEMSIYISKYDMIIKKKIVHDRIIDKIKMEYVKDTDIVSEINIECLGNHVTISLFQKVTVYISYREKSINRFVYDIQELMNIIDDYNDIL